MNKKIIRILRIALYSLALYVILDIFVFSAPSESAQLRAFEKKATTGYWEFFIRYNNEDSNWVVIQTRPILRDPIKVDNPNAWDASFPDWQIFQDMKLEFRGFYLNESILLDRQSFFTLAARIDDLKNNEDKRLKKLHRYSGFTAIFERK